MARTDNLGNFLTDVASAIKQRGGKSGTIPAEDFDTEIENIPAGGGPVNQPKKDVNFYDFDGTRVYSYTKSEFLALEQMPSSPEHSELTFLGWNWGLQVAQDYVTTYGELAIGATYRPNDGATKLYISLIDDNRLDVPICFTQSISQGIEVDWGDGSTPETFTSASSASVILSTHHYSSKGDYIISLKTIIDNCILVLGGNDSSYNVMGNYAVSENGSRYYASVLWRVDMGTNTEAIRSYAFRFCTNLRYMNIPTTVTFVAGNAFADCYALQTLITPSSTSQFSASSFGNCYSLATIVLGMNVSSIPSDTFYNTYSLREIYLPERLTTATQRMFYYAYALPKLIIPKTITYIYQTAFGYCTSIKIFDFSHHTAVPTLGNFTAFTTCTTDYEIIVPDSLYDDWKAANQWTSIASHIVRVSDYTS